MVQGEIKDGKLTLTLDFDKAGSVSASGKSNVHSSTRGYVPLEVPGGNGQYKVNLNVISSKK